MLTPFVLLRTSCSLYVCKQVISYQVSTFPKAFCRFKGGFLLSGCFPALLGLSQDSNAFMTNVSAICLLPRLCGRLLLLITTLKATIRRLQLHHYHFVVTKRETLLRIIHKNYGWSSLFWFCNTQTQTPCSYSDLWCSAAWPNIQLHLNPRPPAGDTCGSWLQPGNALKPLPDNPSVTNRNTGQGSFLFNAQTLFAPLLKALLFLRGGNESSCIINLHSVPDWQSENIRNTVCFLKWRNVVSQI